MPTSRGWSSNKRPWDHPCLQTNPNLTHQWQACGVHAIELILSVPPTPGYWPPAAPPPPPLNNPPPPKRHLPKATPQVDKAPPKPRKEMLSEDPELAYLTGTKAAPSMPPPTKDQTPSSPKELVAHQLP